MKCGNLQTTLINERHLDMSNAENRKWLLEEMDKFFNNEDYAKLALNHRLTWYTVETFL